MFFVDTVFVNDTRPQGWTKDQLTDQIHILLPGWATQVGIGHATTRRLVSLHTYWRYVCQQEDSGKCLMEPIF